MRILHVSAGIGRSNGVMSVILNYARYMPPDIRFDVMHFVETEDDRAEELKALGGRAIKITPPGLHSFRRDDVDEYLSAHRGEYAAIHLHLPYLASILAPKAHRAGVPRVIVHCHSSRFSLENSGWRNRLLNVPTKWLADDLIACGQDAGRVWYGAAAMESSRVTVLPNAIDTEKFCFSPELRAAKRKELCLEDHLVVGHVGTLTTPKNHRFLLPVFAEMQCRRADAVLLLVGEGTLRPQVEEQIRELGIAKSVMLLGNRRDVPELLQAMDVFLFPSLHEGLPVSVVEAQAAGLPVLMSDSVTDEVCVTDHIQRVPLSLGAEQWAERALDLVGLSRASSADHILTAGFDLRSSAAWLAGFYRR